MIKSPGLTALALKLVTTGACSITLTGLLFEEPPKVVVATTPCELPSGKSSGIVTTTTVALDEAETTGTGLPPIVTVASVKYEPVRARLLPRLIAFGGVLLRVLITGASVTSKLKSEFEPPAVVTLTVCEPEAAFGTVTVTLSSALLITVASTPPICTVAPVRKLPLIVTDDPRRP